MSQTFPYDLVKVSGETDENLKRLFAETAWTRWDHTIRELGLIIPEGYRELAPKICNMEVRPDDVWVVTFPKCGTTWTQAIVWNLMTNCKEEEKEISYSAKFPFLEHQAIAKSPFPKGMSEEEVLKLSEEDLEIYNVHTQNFDRIVQMKSPRFIKSHLPFQVLPQTLLDTAKVVFVARNPWDCCASLYNHVTGFKPFAYQYVGTKAQFCELFRKEETPWGSYWNHLKTAWSKRSHPNIHFMWYEDLKSDFDQEVSRLQKFLGTDVNGEKMEELKKRVNIKTLQAMDTRMGGKTMGEANFNFYRRGGQVGGLKKALEDDKEVEKWKDWVKRKVEETRVPIQIPDC